MTSSIRRFLADGKRGRTEEPLKKKKISKLIRLDRTKQTNINQSYLFITYFIDFIHFIDMID